MALNGNINQEIENLQKTRSVLEAIKKTTSIILRDLENGIENQQIINKEAVKLNESIKNVRVSHGDRSKRASKK